MLRQVPFARQWASVNVNTDPDLKREVLDGSIARFWATWLAQAYEF